MKNKNKVWVVRREDAECAAVFASKQDALLYLKQWMDDLVADGLFRINDLVMRECGNTVIVDTPNADANHYKCMSLHKMEVKNYETAAKNYKVKCSNIDLEWSQVRANSASEAAEKYVKRWKKQQGGELPGWYQKPPNKDTSEVRVIEVDADKEKIFKVKEVVTYQARRRYARKDSTV